MKLISQIFFLFLLTILNCYSSENINFNEWKKNFKKVALANNISEKTFDTAMQNARFLPKVIEYDRFQPEFYEDTKTYIGKRTSAKKLKKGVDFYENNSNLINLVEKNFGVEKELLLSLMGIETNFGTYVGKMDIISSLATLSYDKTLYGSWAGAFGFFQFMPSTIKNYAFDYNKDDFIDLKNSEDAYASAANYLNKIGWKKNDLCFKKIELDENIPIKFLNVSARKLHSKKKIKSFKKYIKNYSELNIKNENQKIAIITPDKDIIPDAQTLNPAYIVFENYEIILQWNRSLRFALAVCTLKDKFKNEN